MFNLVDLHFQTQMTQIGNRKGRSISTIRPLLVTSSTKVEISARVRGKGESLNLRLTVGALVGFFILWIPI